MAWRAFVSLRENIQEDVKIRMIRITSKLDSGDLNLEKSY